MENNNPTNKSDSRPCTDAQTLLNLQNGVLPDAEQTREFSLETALTLQQFCPYSMGLGVAAAAFVNAGWQVEHAAPEEFSRRSLPLAVANQQGELAVVFVDTIINGHAPTYPVSEFRERIEKHYSKHFALNRPCYFCTVRLDHAASAERYKVSMTIDPPCPGVENRLPMVASMNGQSILQLCERTESHPAGLDEAMAARLFRDAMADGKWGAFAKWVREDLEYASDTLNSQLHGKTDYMRYMTERVEWWKQGPYPRWPYFRFSVGTVLYKGVRRPCMATYYVGILSAVAVFDLDGGLVVRMRTISRETYCTYIEDEKPRNCNELKKHDRRPPARNVKRPPYAATVPVSIAVLPRDTEHNRILLAVLRHLVTAGTPAVDHPSASAPFPHIWFRGQDMSLRYVIFGPVDSEEAAAPKRLQQLKEWIGLLEYEHLKQLKDYRGYMAYVNNDGKVSLREIPPLD